MRCPVCGLSQFHTVETRQYPYLVRRRKKCLSCGFRTLTVELANFIPEDDLIVEIENLKKQRVKELKKQKGKKHENI